MAVINQFATYQKVKPVIIEQDFFNDVDNVDDYFNIISEHFLNTVPKQSNQSKTKSNLDDNEEQVTFNPFIQDVIITQQPQENNNKDTQNNSDRIDNSLKKIDIEDLLRSEGITSVNGKKIKFGNKNLRSANASFGAKNSNHKKRDPDTGNAMARDISIIGGNINDYTEFRRILLNNERVRNYLKTKGWGIINEVTPEILKRTRGTGLLFHFGPDIWARRTWNGWLQNPNISITSAL